MAALVIQMHSETPRRKQRGIKMDYIFYFAPGGGKYIQEIPPRVLGGIKKNIRFVKIFEKLY